MSFFSFSSNRKHYPNGHKGSGYYQRKGFLGNLFHGIRSHSKSDGYCRMNNGNPHPNSQSPNSLMSNTMLCGGCNSQIPVGSKFCLHCGKKANEALFCPNCGKSLPSNAKFCLECGNKIGG